MTLLWWGGSIIHDTATVGTSFHPQPSIAGRHVTRHSSYVTSILYACVIANYQYGYLYSLGDTRFDSLQDTRQLLVHASLQNLSFLAAHEKARLANLMTVQPFAMCFWSSGSCVNQLSGSCFCRPANKRAGDFDED